MLAAGGAGRADHAWRPGWLGTCGQARRAVRASAERAAPRQRGSHEQRRRVPTAACRERPEAAALQPGSPGPPRSANHVYLLLFLFQGLWQFQEEIR